MSKKRILIFFLLFNGLLLSGQNAVVNAETFSIEDGLSQNFAHYVMQDEKGFIWIGTQDGLNKFDGYRFKVYKRKIDRKNSLSDNLIYSFCKDGDSALWIATQRGLSRYRYRTDDFENYEHQPNNPYSLHTNSIRTVFMGQNGYLWIKSEEGIDRFNPKTKEFVYFQHPFDEFSFTSHYNNFALVQDKEGHIWAAAKDGLMRFDVKSEQFSVYKPTGEEFSEKNEVFSLFLLENNRLLVGTKAGLYYFNIESRTFKPLFNALKNHTITTVFQDSKGGIWIGTNQGLYSAKSFDSAVQFYHAFHSVGYKDNSQITSITEDRSKVLWVTGENGLMKIDLKGLKFKLYRNQGEAGPNFSSNVFFSIYVLDNEKILLGTRKHGLNLFNRKTGKVKVYTDKNSGLQDNNIHVIRQDQHGHILMGTENGIFLFDPTTEAIHKFSDELNSDLSFRFKNNRIADILHDSKGRYWIATFNGLYLFENDTTYAFTNKRRDSRYIPGGEILQIIERKNGEIWAASNNGLMKYNEAEHAFKIYKEQPDGLSHYSILCLNEFSDSTLWIGTEFGLNRYDQKKDTFFVYSSENAGFANDYIYAILEDKKHSIWMSTNSGLIKFDYKNGKTINFRPEHGLQGYEYNIGAAYKAEDGEMFFGGVQGFNAFYPDSVTENYYAPPIIFTEVEILTADGIQRRVITDNKKLVLSYKERTFTVYFTMPDYTHLNENTYQCKIEGLNNEWQDIDNHNYYSVTQIPPGEYRLLVKGFNSDKIETKDIAELHIVIPSPWWMSYWAYAVYITVGILIILWSFFSYNRQIRKENKVLIEKQKTAKKIERQKELLSIKNKNISDSILYAKRIIEAMMPSEKYIKRLLPDSFVLFIPKDIVSGDFYWADYRDGIVYVAVVDCTGHGVPGAFMSIVGLNLLRDILSLGVENPAVILDRMDKEVKEIFSSEDEYSERVKDGMDMTICAIDKKNKCLQFAGAKNPLYLIRDDQVIEYKGDRFSVGPGNDEDTHFQNHIIDLQDNDIVYMFSDGYADQFGGPKNKKFKYRRFRSVLLDIYKKNTGMQQNDLREIITRWKSGAEQVDDILIMGIRPLTKNVYEK